MEIDKNKKGYGRTYGYPTEKEFNLSEFIDNSNEKIEAFRVKEFIKRLKDDENKIMLEEVYIQIKEKDLNKLAGDKLLN